MPCRCWPLSVHRWCHCTIYLWKRWKGERNVWNVINLSAINQQNVINFNFGYENDNNHNEILSYFGTWYTRGFHRISIEMFSVLSALLCCLWRDKLQRLVTDPNNPLNKSYRVNHKCAIVARPRREQTNKIRRAEAFESLDCCPTVLSGTKQERAKHIKLSYVFHRTISVHYIRIRMTQFVPDWDYRPKYGTHSRTAQALRQSIEWFVMNSLRDFRQTESFGQKLNMCLGRQDVDAML